MNLADVRRLMLTVSVLAALDLGWLVALGLHAQGLVHAPLAASALDAMPLSRWLWFGNFGIALALVGLTVMAYLVRTAPAGFARGIARQVQCQDCKAVFMIHDTGYRPITHVCPNCKAIGVFDGMAPPVGVPPRPAPARRIIDLGLSCQTCDHAFNVTDTGARPMRIRCPRCRADGVIR